MNWIIFLTFFIYRSLAVSRRTAALDISGKKNHERINNSINDKSNRVINRLTVIITKVFFICNMYPEPSFALME